MNQKNQQMMKSRGEAEKVLYQESAKFGEIARSHNAVDFAAESQYALSILENNSYLMKCAVANPPSLKQAILNVAGTGISLNPMKAHAYLVPRYITGQMAVCLDVSYRGLIHLAEESGSIEWVQAELVYEGEVLNIKGFGEAPEHRRDPFDRKDKAVIGAYCVAKTHKGDYLTTAMGLEEIEAVRDRSEAWKAYEKDNKKKCPWVTDAGEMMKKTVIKRASKTWPKANIADRLDEAIKVINEHEGIDFKSEQAPQEPSTPVIDYSEREEQLQDIRERLGGLTDGLSLEQKGEYLEEHFEIKSFNDFKARNNDQLDEVIEKLKSLSNEKERKALIEKTKDQLDDKEGFSQDIGAIPPKCNILKSEHVPDREPKKEIRNASDASFRLDNK